MRDTNTKKNLNGATYLQCKLATGVIGWNLKVCVKAQQQNIGRVADDWFEWQRNGLEESYNR